MTSAASDKKFLRVRRCLDLPPMDTVQPTAKNKHSALTLEYIGGEGTVDGSPSGTSPFRHESYDFVGGTVPDNTDYPDSIAPIGSTYLRLIISAQAVGGAALYIKTAAATWTQVTAITPFVVVVTAVKTANYTALITDDVVRANTSGGAFTLTLPTAVGNAGKEFLIKLTTGGSVLTIDGNGAETIDGAANRTLLQTGDWLRISSDGANWMVMGYSGAEDQVYVKDITVTTGELLALNATPKELVAAPGSGKIIVLQSAQLMLDFNTTAYDGIASGEDLTFKYTDGSGAQVAVVEATGFLDQGADEHRIVQSADAVAVEPVANAALVLHMSTGEIATGNSPLKVRVRYKVMSLQT